MLAAFANNYDKSRYEDFVKSVNEMKKYLKGSHFKDLAVETIEGKPANLKDIVMPDKYNFLDFWASWCGPCRALGPTIEALSDEYAGRVAVAKVDVDKAPATASKWRIQSIPAIIALRNGVEVGRVVGNAPAKVKELIESLAQ